MCNLINTHTHFNKYTHTHTHIYLYHLTTRRRVVILARPTRPFHSIVPITTAFSFLYLCSSSIRETLVQTPSGQQKRMVVMSTGEAFVLLDSLHASYNREVHMGWKGQFSDLIQVIP